MTSGSDLDLAYRKSLDAYWLRLSRVAVFVGMVLVSAGVTLDILVYPDHWRMFALLRLLCDGLLVVVALLYLTVIGRRLFRGLTFFWMLAIQAMICYMIMATEGPLSPYYAGLNLSVLAVGIFLPATVMETFVFSLLTLVLYLFAILPLNLDGITLGIAYNNSYFLILTAVITLFASYFSGRRRFEEFRLSFELDRRNRELSELDRIKSEFFANISHELRTPLTLILSPVQDILETHRHLSERVSTALGTVRNNALRLLKLVNDLLDVIRLEEGKFELEKTPVVIDPLVAAVSESMIHLADVQGVELGMDPGAEDRLVLGDPAALEKVFINLINNAVKFCPAGGSVSVSTQVVGEGVCVAVRDTGIGISEQDLPHIFERFRQADGSTTRRYRGTGLGLALVKDLVDRHGGSVRVQSSLGKGTTVFVSLPLYALGEEERVAEPRAPMVGMGIQRLHRLAEANAGIQAEPVEGRDEPGPHYGPEDQRPRILVVDDEPEMRRYLVSMLAEDYRVLEAADGAQGLAMARREVPDLMLLDLMLPEIDGLEVCRRLKSDRGTRRIRIILLTARVDEEAKISALGHGADDFITKPFSRVEVRGRLANLYTSARLESELEHTNESLRQTLDELRRTQSQLVQSEKLNALGRLAAGLLHEINNPLNYTLTALQLLKGDPEVAADEVKQEIVADIDEGMQRIRAIVGDLRSFAYPTGVQVEEECDLNTAVDAALRFTVHELKGIRVERALPEPAMVLASNSHLTQVLINLLTNAAKAIAAARDSGGVIRIRAGVDGDRMRVVVADNGIGMDEDTRKRIFDPFFTTRDVGEGMGLGLSICHTIIANHRGMLAASSRPGEGSELVFDLGLPEQETLSEEAS